jgi:hypothetical protein
MFFAGILTIIYATGTRPEPNVFIPCLYEWTCECVA